MYFYTAYILEMKNIKAKHLHAGDDVLAMMERRDYKLFMDSMKKLTKSEASTEEENYGLG
jgi:hypothetical protein